MPLVVAVGRNEVHRVGSAGADGREEGSMVDDGSWDRLSLSIDRVSL